MTQDLLGLATDLAGRAKSGEVVEAFLTHELNFYVKVFSGEVEALSASEPRGAGARVFSEGRVGFSYTTDLSAGGRGAMLDAARENASFVTPDDAIGPAEPSDGPPQEIEGMVDRGQEDVRPDSKVRFAVELDRATAARDKRVRAVEESVYSDSDTEIAIATSNGISGTYRRTDAWCFSLAIAEEDDDTQVGFEFDLARGLNHLDAVDVGQRAADNALTVLGASKIPSARMPVVFEPFTAGQFLGVLGQALTGEAVQKGRSLFAGRTGETVAASGLTMFDDGRLPGAPGSAPWDDEGVPTSRTDIIAGGVLRSFLYDSISARREGRASTGNASRSGFKSVPGAAPSNLALKSTGQSRDELLQGAGKVLLVQDFHGVHSGANPVSGDFSVGVTGMLLDGGEIVQPVKEVTIAAPMLEILSNIRAVADDRRWLPFGGSFGGATTLVSEMTVGGL
ncbi:MAG: TldD/PmbA family protein [Actinomycetota bacterium]|nr:TldD/PmbA family protein [Actinomycetota bacterium]